VAVSSATESVLGRSPNGTFRVGVVGELAAKFQKMDEGLSRLERPTARIYDLLLGPPFGRAQLTNRLDKAVG
jgi:hypothetical protein